MKLKLLYFGIVREKLGRGEEEREVREGLTVGGLLQELAASHKLFALGAGVLRVAVNREYEDEGRLLRDGDEVAIIPPVAGGAGTDGAGAHGAGTRVDAPGGGSRIAAAQATTPGPGMRPKGKRTPRCS